MNFPTGLLCLWESQAVWDRPLVVEIYIVGLRLVLCIV